MEEPLARRLNYHDNDRLRRSLRGKGGSPSLGCAVLSFVLLLAVILLPLVLKNEINNADLQWTGYTSEVHDPDCEQSSDASNLRSMGYGSAVVVSVISGAAIALSTCVCMYYDSHKPGLEPPSPCSPLSCGLYKIRSCCHSNINLGYYMAKVNGVVGFIVTLTLLLLYTRSC